MDGSRETGKDVNSNLRLPCLCLTLGVSLWALLKVLPMDPLLLTPFHHWLYGLGDAQDARLRESRVADPPMGGLLPTKLQQQLQPQLESRRPIILLWIGTCQGCILRDVMRWEELCASPTGPVLVLVAGLDQDSSERFRKEESVKAPVIGDADGSIAAWLNPIWSLRWLVVSPEGRALAIQQHPAARPEQALYAMAIQAPELRLPLRERASEGN